MRRYDPDWTNRKLRRHKHQCRGPKPTQTPEISPKHRVYTNFPKSSCELLPSSLWQESGTQWKSLKEKPVRSWALLYLGLKRSLAEKLPSRGYRASLSRPGLWHFHGMSPGFWPVLPDLSSLTCYRAPEPPKCIFQVRKKKHLWQQRKMAPQLINTSKKVH